MLGAAICLGLGLAPACGGQQTPEPTAEPKLPARRSAAALDDCAVEPGKPPPDPLKRDYQGVAAKARCDREVYTIMGGVVHSLGVACEYCHVKDNYPESTHRKQVANWMARELIPTLRAKTGEDIWCSDCHHVGDKGTPKPLGKPRAQSAALEWMNTQLVARFETKDGEPLYCKGCHGGNVGSPDFKAKLILTDLLGDKTFAADVGEGGSPPAPTSDAGAPEASPPAKPDAGPASDLDELGDRK